jgi:diguanylate cyclase (GGDEF)-like protein/PAS domain S-box-containing protein
MVSSAHIVEVRMMEERRAPKGDRRIRRNSAESLREMVPLRRATDWLERAFDAMPDLVAVLDTTRRVVRANRSMREVFGPDILGTRCFECFGHGDRPVEDCPFTRATRDGREFTRGVHLAHLQRHYRVTVSPVFDATGRLEGCVHVAQDVTERKLAEEANRETQVRLDGWVQELERRSREISLLNEMGRLLQSCESVEKLALPITWFAEKLFLEESGELHLCSPGGEITQPLLSWGEPPVPAPAFERTSCWALQRSALHVVEDLDASPLCPHTQALRHGTLASLCLPITVRDELLGVLCMRRMMPVEGAVPIPGVVPTGPPYFPEHRQRLAMAFAERVALAVSNLRLRAELHEQSVRDALTGLFNRRFLDEFLERELARASRAGASIAVVMMDIDHFKRLNDTHGHEAGDVVLAALGRCLAEGTRLEDVPCRYGGEEFLLVMPGLSASGAVHRAEELLERIGTLEVSGKSGTLGPIRLSMGVAAFPEHGASSQALLQAADAALYRAKSEGRARVVLAQTLN